MKLFKYLLGIIATLLLLQTHQSVQASSWTNTTGQLNVGRAEFTANKLPNGYVLVAGGENPSAVRSAELYNPTTKTWSFTGFLTTGRYEHASSLVTLGNSSVRVIAIGGSSVNGIEATTELYNPSTGTWSAGPSMAYSRSISGGSLLNDGKYIVAGGVRPYSNITNTVEIYDPTVGTIGSWSTKTSMSEARYSHTTTLLDNGKILVTGGAHKGGMATSSSELYDPATDTWTMGPSMSYARATHTATKLPNGNVLVVGGNSNTAEIYDPTYGSIGRWISAANTVYGHRNHTASLITLSDYTQRVLITGGTSTSGNKAELYDPATDSWTETNSLSTNRYWHTATVLNDGTTLIVGGYAVPTLRSSEYYTSD